MQSARDRKRLVQPQYHRSVFSNMLQAPARSVESPLASLDPLSNQDRPLGLPCRSTNSIRGSTNRAGKARRSLALGVPPAYGRRYPAIPLVIPRRLEAPTVTNSAKTRRLPQTALHWTPPAA